MVQLTNVLLQVAVLWQACFFVTSFVPVQKHLLDLQRVPIPSLMPTIAESQ